MFTILKSIPYLACASFAAALLSACAHTPSADDIPPGATFTANILADNTKLFVYTQRFGRGGPARDEYAEIDGYEGRGRSSGGGRERGAERSGVSQAAQKGVQAMLAQNKYCRDGYMVLEQYDQHGSYVVRGECRDAATADDRNKFPPSH